MVTRTYLLGVELVRFVFLRGLWKETKGMWKPELYGTIKKKAIHIIVLDFEVVIIVDENKPYAIVDAIRTIYKSTWD